MARRFTIELDDMEAATVELIAAEEGMTADALLRHLVRTHDFRRMVLFGQNPRFREEAAIRRRFLMMGLRPTTPATPVDDREGRETPNGPPEATRAA